MILRGMDLPRRINAERLNAFPAEQRKVLEQELQALDQNLREVLTRIEVNVARLSPTGSFRTLPSGLFVPQILESLPTLPNVFFPEGALVVLTSDWKLYRNDGGTWSAAVETVDLSGTIDLDTQVSGTLATAFAEAGLINGNVTINSDGTLTGAGGGQASLTQLPGQVQAGSIAANAVTAGTIAALAVTTAKLDALAVTTDKLAANAVTAAKIAANTITANEIAANTITAAQIAAGAIGADELQANSVVAGKIDANAVTATEIAAGSVTATKISVSSLSAVSANMGTLTAGKIDVGNIEINADTEQILFGSATAPMTGTGIFMGLSSAVYQFRVGNPAGEYIHWDGSALVISGESFTGGNPVFDGNIEVNAAQGAVRIHLFATGGSGIINLYGSDDAAAGGIVGGASTFELIAAPNHDLILDVSSGEYLRLVGLPTSDPGGSGRVWNDSGTLKIT